MARGLSPLQRTILTLAWQQRPERRQLDESRYEQAYDPFCWPLRQRPWPWLRIADIYPQDLYVLHYGWPITYGGWKDGRETRLLRQAKHFAPAQIGERTYRTVTAAVSRSFHRLASRGYLTREGNGWLLTEAGAAVAAQLSVK